MKHHSIIFYFVLLVTSIQYSCSKPIYNAWHIFETGSLLDTASTKVNIRIVNEGTVGISSIAIMTDSGKVILAGAKPKDTTRYFAIFPLRIRPFYEVQVARRNFWGQTTVYAERLTWHSPTDTSKLTSGFFSLYIAYPKKEFSSRFLKRNRKIRASRFHIAKDR